MQRGTLESDQRPQCFLAFWFGSVWFLNKRSSFDLGPSGLSGDASLRHAAILLDFRKNVNVGKW
jgi:hypothetical protein